MFSKSKISQSMLDAVNSVINEEDKKLLLEPGKSTKLPIPTGTKVLGHRYGNSAKAHKDQTSHEIDKVKEPSNKELAKESFEDEHGISDKSFKSKLMNKAKKSMKEGKGNGPQETFTDNNMGESHVETTHKSPAKGTDLADKSYLKDMGKKPSVKSDIKNLGRFLAGKKETNEETVVEAKVTTPDSSPDTVTTDMIKGREIGGKSNAFKPFKLKLKSDGEMKAPELEAGGAKGNPTHGTEVKLKNVKEESEIDAMINEVISKDAKAGDWIHDFVHSDNPKFAGKSKAERKKQALAAYYSKQNEEVELDEGRMKDIATDKDEDERLGTWQKETPWKQTKGTVTDKSGAKHTPMSRAKDLARSAFKKLQKETMMGKISN